MRRSFLRTQQLVPQEQIDILNNSLKTSGFSSPTFSPISPGLQKRFSFDKDVIDVEEQKKMILRLKRENESIKEILEQTRLEDEGGSELNAEDYEHAIELEERKIAELDRQLENAFENINAKRQVVEELNDTPGTPSAIEKQLSILKAKFNKGNQKFKEALTFNRKLRQQVDTLRCERVIFDNLYKKLQNEVDKENYTSEVVEENDQENKSSPKKIAQELRLQNQRLNSDTEIAEQLRKYEEDIAKIQAAFPDMSFQDFTKTLVKKEEENVKDFKCLNDLTNEVETLKKGIADLKKEEKKYIEESSKYEDAKAIKEMKDNLKRLERKNTHYESKSEEVEQILKDITSSVGNLFEDLECKNIAPETMSSKAIDEKNLTSYFDLLEERSSQIIKYYLDKKHIESTYATPIEYLTNSYTTKAKKEIPAFVEYSDDDEDDADTLLSMDDFMQKAMEKLDSTQPSPMLSDIVSPAKSKKW